MLDEPLSINKWLHITETQMQKAQALWGEASLINGGKNGDEVAAEKARFFKALEATAAPTAHREPKPPRLNKSKTTKDERRAKRKAQRHARKRA